MRPALISRTNDRLICATTRKLRKRERRKPAIDDSSFNAGTSCGFDDCSAGMRLKRIPVVIREQQREREHAPVGAQIEEQSNVAWQANASHSAIDCGSEEDAGRAAAK